MVEKELKVTKFSNPFILNRRGFVEIEDVVNVNGAVDQKSEKEKEVDRQIVKSLKIKFELVQQR